MKRDTLAVVLIVVVGLFVLGAAAPDKGEVGRFQVVAVDIGFAPAGGKDFVLMVDTKTGKTRAMVRLPNDKGEVGPIWGGKPLMGGDNW